MGIKRNCGLLLKVSKKELGLATETLVGPYFARLTEATNFLESLDGLHEAVTVRALFALLK